MKKYKFLTRISCGILILLTACSGPKVPQQFDHNVSSGQVGISSGKIAALDSIMQSFVDDKKVNCAVGFVAKNGQPLTQKIFL